jgi:hypothetical protein
MPFYLVNGEYFIGSVPQSSILAITADNKKTAEEIYRRFLTEQANLETSARINIKSTTELRFPITGLGDLVTILNETFADFDGQAE